MRAHRMLTAGRWLILTLAVAVLPACDVVVTSMNASGKAQDEWTRSYPISPTGLVEIVNGNGLVDVLAGEGPGVEVRAERIVRANTDDAAKELLRQVQIKEEVSGDHIRLETVTPSGGGFHRHAEIRYHVKVPATVSVRARNTNGEVVVAGIHGEVHAETTNGRVRGRDLSGTVEASTTNGGVQLDLDEIGSGGVRAQTTNGSVDVTIPENAGAELRANCVHGGIAVSGFKVEDGQSSRNHVEGRLNGGGPRLTLDTTNGGIRVNAGAAATRK